MFIRISLHPYPLQFPYDNSLQNNHSVFSSFTASLSTICFTFFLSFLTLIIFLALTYLTVLYLVYSSSYLSYKKSFFILPTSSLSELLIFLNIFRICLLSSSLAVLQLYFENSFSLSYINFVDSLTNL